MKTLIDEAADLLNAERVRLYCEPLCVVQREALYNEATWRGELSNMDFYGYDVSAARVLLERHYVGEEY